MNETPRVFYLMLILFAGSGFAGLIYESIWVQYLKLFLGHAAYAQTMVLCIFMGGMAIGAWLAARYARKISNPLLVYAVIEVTIGLFAFGFHGGFTRAVEYHYQHLLPLTASPFATTAFKGFLALLLIGPQTILLGATFPLMTAGVLRALPQSPGKKIAQLYFTNSMGAAVGVLLTGFVLVPWSGLPGTMLTAGIVNIVIGVAVWLVVRGGGMLGRTNTGADKRVADYGGLGQLSPRLLLATAAFTGIASFIYEVVWIRMLSLVLGASTHSFELMLSAFISGLALGSLAIRRHIDRVTQSYRMLGYVQILMGLLALGSLWVYSESFLWMGALMRGVARTEQGYTLFLLASHAICFLVMLPATFLAGMTLPLITHGLLRSGYGERAVGDVYALNTIGSIVGVAFALHIAIPLTGLKVAMIIGGSIDVLMGIVLLAMTVTGLLATRPAAIVLGAIGIVIAISVGVTLDPYRLNSGVYRYERAALPSDFQFLYLGDGKTAGISLYKDTHGGRVLATNGKPDGKINKFADAPSGDDLTTTLLAAIGMAFHPEARSAANIGLGTGVTTRTLLRNPRLERVDTIEIESKVIEAVQLLRDEVDVVFTDPRSTVHVDDAKSFFAAHRARYDIIVAEPSNPWVSGVASLFTKEFYGRMRDHLTERGIFVQWLQAYEIDLECVASVMLALGQAFPNYSIYTSNGSDLFVVAWKDESIREPDADVLNWQELKADWRRVGIDGIQDIEARRIGGRAVMGPLFRSYSVPENSDFFPYLDDRAVRARFLGRSADALNTLRTSTIALVEMLEKRFPMISETTIAQKSFVHRSVATRDAAAVHRFLRGEALPDGLLPETRIDLAVLAHFCNGKGLFDGKAGLSALIRVISSTIPYLTQGESRQVLAALHAGSCLAGMGEMGRLIGDLAERMVERNGIGMRASGERLLGSLSPETDRGVMKFALDTAMVGSIMAGSPENALTLWQKHRRQDQVGRAIPIENRLMLSIAEVRTKRH